MFLQNVDRRVIGQEAGVKGYIGLLWLRPRRGLRALGPQDHLRLLAMCRFHRLIRIHATVGLVAPKELVLGGQGVRAPLWIRVGSGGGCGQQWASQETKLHVHGHPDASLPISRTGGAGRFVAISPLAHSIHAPPLCRRNFGRRIILHELSDNAIKFCLQLVGRPYAPDSASQGAPELRTQQQPQRRLDEQGRPQPQPQLQPLQQQLQQQRLGSPPTREQFAQGAVHSAVQLQPAPQVLTRAPHIPCADGAMLVSTRSGRPVGGRADGRAGERHGGGRTAGRQAGGRAAERPGSVAVLRPPSSSHPRCGTNAGTPASGGEHRRCDRIRSSPSSPRNCTICSRPLSSAASAVGHGAPAAAAWAARAARPTAARTPPPPRSSTSTGCRRTRGPSSPCPPRPRRTRRAQAPRSASTLARQRRPRGRPGGVRIGAGATREVRLGGVNSGGTRVATEESLAPAPAMQVLCCDPR